MDNLIRCKFEQYKRIQTQDKIVKILVTRCVSQKVRLIIKDLISRALAGFFSFCHGSSATKARTLVYSHWLLRTSKSLVTSNKGWLPLAHKHKHKHKTIYADAVRC